MSFFSKKLDESPETRDRPRRFVLSRDHRSIFDIETKTTAIFDKSVPTEDIEDYYAYLNLGAIEPERLKWS